MKNQAIKINKPHVAHNTGNPEWYTPLVVIDAARAVLGEIDLDSASSDIAQKTVGATIYYTKENDGLSHPWSGRVWLNPPYARGLIDAFVEKLCQHYSRGEVTEALTLTNNSSDTQWFHHLARHASSLCVVEGRVKFLDPEGNPGGPLQGQTIMYLGRHPDKFVESFSEFGLLFGPVGGFFSDEGNVLQFPAGHGLNTCS